MLDMLLTLRGDMQWTDQILLIALGYLIPVFLAWLFEYLKKTVPSFEEWLKNHPNVASIGLSALVAIPISATAIVVYDRFFRPAVPHLISEIKYVTKERDWTSPFANSDKNRIVMITARNGVSVPTNTMCGSVSKTASELPHAASLCANGTTVVSASFTGRGDQGFSTSMTFVVPPDYFYNVHNDGASPVILNWTEADF